MVDIVRTYVSSAASGTDASVYTFASQALGTASSDRYILVGIAARSAATQSIASVTVAGESASLAVAGTTGTGANTLAAFYIAAVPTGTTGDVVVTFNANAVRCVVACWSLVNLGSTTPTDSAHNNSDPATASLDIDAGGAAFALTFNASNETSITWTNLTGDVNYFGTLEASNSASFASAEFSSAQTALALTGDWGTATTTPYAAWVSFAPAAGGTTHDTTGALTGAGSTVAGSAAHIAVHGTSGALTGPGASVVGGAARAGGATTHDTTGALAGQGAIVDGAAARVAAPVTHGTSGDLVGPGAVISGQASGPNTQAFSGGWFPPVRRRTKKELDDERRKLGILPPEVVEEVAAAPVARRRITLQDLIGKKAAAEITNVDLSQAIAASKKRKRQRDDELLLLM